MKRFFNHLKFHSLEKGGITCGDNALSPIFTVVNGRLTACANVGEEVVIPTGVTEIAGHVFANTPLRRVVFSKTVKKLDADAFAFCCNLERVEFSTGLEKIGERAFLGCEKLSEITLPQSVVEIGKNAFSNCKNLQTVYIPKSVKKVGANLFLLCERLAITCEVESRPLGWHRDWNEHEKPVAWGVKK